MRHRDVVYDLAMPTALHRMRDFPILIFQLCARKEFLLLALLLFFVSCPFLWNSAAAEVLEIGRAGAEPSAGAPVRPDESQASADDSPFSFLAVGDTGMRLPLGMTPPVQLSVGRAMAKQHRKKPVDLLVFLGDNLYDFSDSEDEPETRVRSNFARPYCAFFASDAPLFDRLQSVCPKRKAAKKPIPVLAVLGNHDHGNERSKAFQCLDMKQYLSNWNPMCGVVQVLEQKGVSLVLYDSDRMQAENRYADLTDALRASRGPWRILLAHKPITAGEYGVKIQDAIRAADVVVQLHLAGHDHNLQIAAPPSSPIFLQAVSGAGGEAREVRHQLEGLLFVDIVPGFLRIDLEGDDTEKRLVVSAVEVEQTFFRRLHGTKLQSRWSVSLTGDVQNTRRRK